MFCTKADVDNASLAPCPECTIQKIQCRLAALSERRTNLGIDGATRKSSSSWNERQHRPDVKSWSPALATKPVREAVEALFAVVFQSARRQETVRFCQKPPKGEQAGLPSPAGSMWQRRTYCAMLPSAACILTALSPTSCGWSSRHVIAGIPGIRTSSLQECPSSWAGLPDLPPRLAGPHMYSSPPEKAIIHWKTGGGLGSERMIRSQEC